MTGFNLVLKKSRLSLVTLPSGWKATVAVTFISKGFPERVRGSSAHFVSAFAL
jgi:hypothetical protein